MHLNARRGHGRAAQGAKKRPLRPENRSGRKSLFGLEAGDYSTRTRTTLGRADSFSTRSGWKVPVASSMV